MKIINIKKYFIFLFFIFFQFGGAAKEFTIAVIPDTQCYNYRRCQTSFIPPYPVNQLDIWKRQMEYILNNCEKKQGSIAFAVHLGDLCEGNNANEDEWKNADTVMSILDGNVPYLVVPGNHDCDKWVRENKKTYYEGWEYYLKYFGSNSIHFLGKEWYKGAYNNGLDSYAIMKTNGYNFLVIGLELEPENDVIDWVQSVLEQYKGYPTIIVMHEYLMLTYDKKRPGVPAIQNKIYMRKGENRNTPQDFYDKIVTKNDQIFMILSGHNFVQRLCESTRVDVNDFGHDVYALHSDFQYRSELIDESKIIGKKQGCGDGWMRLMTFNIPEKMIKVETYSTETNKYEKDMDSAFTIYFDFDWNERFSRGIDK